MRDFLLLIKKIMCNHEQTWQSRLVDRLLITYMYQNPKQLLTIGHHFKQLMVTDLAQGPNSGILVVVGLELEIF